MKNISVRLFTMLVLVSTLATTGFSQNKYEAGWQSLNEADVPGAIKNFEAAVKKDVEKEKALLCLTMLHSHMGRQEKSAEYFSQYMDIAADPYPALYALWKEDGVAGLAGKLEPHQVALMQRLYKDKRNAGKLMGGTTYRLVSHHVMSFDLDSSIYYAKQIGNLEDWMMAGPFDNVMNSGYDKDFGVVGHPEPGATFVSKYGADITWFEPKIPTGDGYVFKGMYFNSINSIIYAQTFVQADAKKEVYLNAGYSGSLKIWVNDSLIYREPEHRMTEMDWKRFKLTLNEGYNRILVQLGEHEESFANFTLRLTDMEHNPLHLPQKNGITEYKKGLEHVEAVPFFADAPLNELQKKDDLLGSVLLAKAYMRSLETPAAEHVLLTAFEKYPKNYIILRELVMMYDKSGDQTNQNKFYRLYEKYYPEDKSVLENQISEQINKDEKTKVKESVEKYLKLYPDKYMEMAYDLVLAGFDDDNEKMIKLIEDMYKEFPDQYDAVSQKYGLEKSFYSKPEKAKQVLKDYLKTNYSYDILMELASIYHTDGQIDSVISLLETNIEIVPYSIESYRQIVSLLSNQSKYKDAIKVGHKLLGLRPSDYEVLQDVARLHRFDGNTDSAVYYFSESLRYFPFEFDVNERIRELQGKKMVLDMLPEIKPEKMIKEYEAKFKAPIKKSFDIVMDVTEFIIFNSKATGVKHSYIIKINDEAAISSWQKVNLSPRSTNTVSLNDAFTIKKDGDKIDAEVNEYSLVFTNLEVGDYVYVSSTEKQVTGGKSSVFVWENFALNSSYPTYLKEFSVYLEKGLSLRDSVMNPLGEMTKKKQGDFDVYKWTRYSPELVPDERNSPSFNDIAEKLHVGLDYSWSDIVQWYSDLSGYQASADLTIKNIVNELFAGKEMTELGKFQAIYEFVIKNIRYSSIDFRQSGYIPQKASTVYHSRLGDCKDLATLFASIAREAGLKANLLLVNTSNNGKNAVVLPSLNFNHCMIKVYYGNGESLYLELTDTDLPFGHLYAYHEDAAILEIPSDPNSKVKPMLEHLKLNKGYKTAMTRNTTATIHKDLTMDVVKDVISTGRMSASMARTYHNEDEEKCRDILLRAITPLFKSSVNLKEFHFESVEPRKDTSLYDYSIKVESDVINMGAFKSIKLPFSDVLVQLKVFQDADRKTPFDYPNYESVDEYNESILVTIDSTYKFLEVPENVSLTGLGNKYDLAFEKVSDHQMKVTRQYIPNRAIVSLDKFKEFETFMKAVNEGENTYLIFK